MNIHPLIEDSFYYLGSFSKFFFSNSKLENLIVLNVAASLHRQLRQQPCEVYSNGLRVKVSETGLYTYPDVIIARETPIFEDAEVDTLLNPTVIIEVLSQSTEGYDRSDKFDQYKTIASFTDYILITQSEHLVEHYRRQADNSWSLVTARQLDQGIDIASIGCTLRLRDIYEKVQVDQPSLHSTNGRPKR